MTRPFEILAVFILCLTLVLLNPILADAYFVEAATNHSILPHDPS